jgi:tetratricopeptide (TPR) repeat protein
MKGSPPASRRPTGARLAASRSTGERHALPPGSAKLVVTAGPRKGAEFALGEGSVTIGRAVECEISIPDTSVSRRHASVRQIDDEWFAADQGSGNGTLINDAEVRGDVRLRDGDRITLGDTELTFVMASKGDATQTDLAAPPLTGSHSSQELARRSPERPQIRPRPRSASRESRSNPGRRRRLMFGLVAVLVGGAVVAGLVNRKLEKEREAIAAAEEAKRKDHEQVMVVFQDGKNLVRAGQWKQAFDKFKEVEKLSPMYPGLKEYLERAPKEVANEVQLEQASAALSEEKLGAANEALTKITPDTTLEERVASLRTAMQEKANARVDAARVAQAAKDHRVVVEITDDVLAAFPEHRDARALNEQSKAVLENRERPTQLAASSIRPWTAAISLYREGDIPGATASLVECSNRGMAKCGTLLKHVREVGEMSKSLDSMGDKELAKLLALDEQITDGQQSKMAKAAGAKASATFFRAATTAKAAGQWGKAVEMAKRTLRADADHAGARAIVNELKAKAKEVYLQGYTLKDGSPEEAAEKFREVLQMTTPDDDSYQKSKKWLETLSR